MSSRKRDLGELLNEQLQARGVRIDLGCGRHKQPGFIGVDRQQLEGVDVVQDLESFPWVFPDECAELVVASHLVEHINPADGGFLKFMDEVWRILKPGGQFMASMPYAGSPGYWQDPTHVNGCTEITWLYFDPLEDKSNGLMYSFYTPKPWKIVNIAYELVGNMEVALEKRMEDRSYAGQ